MDTSFLGGFGQCCWMYIGSGLLHFILFFCCCHPSSKFSCSSRGSSSRHVSRVSHPPLAVTTASTASHVSPGMFPPGRGATLREREREERERARSSSSVQNTCSGFFSWFRPFFLLPVCSTEVPSQLSSLSAMIYQIHNLPTFFSF